MGATGADWRAATCSEREVAAVENELSICDVVTFDEFAS